MKSTPTRGVKQYLKPNAYKQSEGGSLQLTAMSLQSAVDETRMTR